MRAHRPRCKAPVCLPAHNPQNWSPEMRNAVRSLLILALAILLTSAFPFNAQDDHSNETGAEFVMTNNVDGSLRERRRLATGGRGTGGLTDPLESQGSLTLSQDHSWLFAVNGGSGDVSVFYVQGPRLVLADKKP